MARPSQIILLLLLAVCAVQCISRSSRRGSSHGRSHGRRHFDDDYNGRSRSYRNEDRERRSDNSKSLEDDDHKKNKATTELVPGSTPKVPTIYVGKETGDENPFNKNTINVNGMIPDDDKKRPNFGGDSGGSTGSINDKPEPGTIFIDGLSPSDDSKEKSPDGGLSIDGKFPNINDKPSINGLDHNKKPTKVGGNSDNNSNTIIVDGLNPGDDNNPSEDVNNKLKPDNPKGDKNNNNNALLPGGDGVNPSNNIDDGGLVDLGKPDHNSINVDGSKPNNKQPGTSDLNNDGLPLGGEDGADNNLPDEIQPGPMPSVVKPGVGDRPSDKHPSEDRPGRGKPSNKPLLPGKFDINVNGMKNNSVLMPIYIPGFGHSADGKGQIPAFFIVMINGQPTLVHNPAVFGDSGDHQDLPPGLFGGLSSWLNPGAVGSGVGGGFSMLPFWFGSQYPGFGIGGGYPGGIYGKYPSFTVPSYVPSEPQPYPVPVPQPVPMPVPEPVYPGGYPGIPYPYPWTGINPGPGLTVNVTGPAYPNPGVQVDWPNLIEILLNLLKKPGAQPPSPGIQPPQPVVPKPQPAYPDPQPSYPVPKPQLPQPGPQPQPPYPGPQPSYPGPVPTNPNPQPQQPGPLPPYPLPTPQPPQPGPKPQPPQPSYPGPVPTDPVPQPPQPGPKPQPPQPSYPGPVPTDPVPQPPQPGLLPPYPVPKPQPSYPDKVPTDPIPQPPQPGPQPSYPTPQPSYPGPVPTTPKPQPPQPIPQPQPPQPGPPPPNPSPKPQPPQPGPGDQPTIGNKDPAEPTPGPQPPYPDQPVVPKPLPPAPVPESPFREEPDNKPSPPPVPTPKPSGKLPQPGPKPNPDPQPSPNKPYPENPKPNNPGLDNPDKGKDSSKGGKPHQPHIRIPLTVIPGSNNGKPGAYDPSLINLVNVILKQPNPTIRPKGPKDTSALEKQLLAALKQHTGENNLKELLAILNQNKEKNQPSLGDISELLHLLDSHNQPNLNILVEPGMDEAKRTNMMLLLNLLASNLASSGSSSYYESNVSNPLLYFLGHFPCEHPNIHASGLSGMQAGLWQLLANMYGNGKGNLNILRYGRSAEENDESNATTPDPKLFDTQK